MTVRFVEVQIQSGLAPAAVGLSEARPYLLVGLVDTTRRIWWGESLGMLDETAIAAAGELTELAAWLNGHISNLRPGDWPALQGSLAEAYGDSIAASLLPALEQALVDWFAKEWGIAPAEVLSQAGGLPPPPTEHMFATGLAVRDLNATPQFFDAVIRQRPDLIAYMLTGTRASEAIGHDAELLQRFVRELSGRVNVLGDSAYSPRIYLGLNGALGALVGSPAPNMGSILGKIVGLQAAAAPLALTVEDPFLTADQVEHVSSTRLLRSFMDRQAMLGAARLAAWLPDSRDELARMLLETQAAQVARLQVGRGLTYTLEAIERVKQSGAEAVLWIDRRLTSRWIHTAVQLGLAAQVDTFLIDAGEGTIFTLNQFEQAAAEETARLRQSAQSRIDNTTMATL